MAKNVFVEIYEKEKGTLSEEAAIARRKEIEKFDPLAGCTLDPKFKEKLEAERKKAEIEEKEL